MVDKTIKIRIVAEAENARNRMRDFGKAVDDSTARAKRLGKQLEDLERGSTTSFTSLARGALDFAAKLNQAGELVSRTARVIGELADEANRTSAVFDNLTIALAPARKATHGLVGDMELAIAANKAMRFGVVDNAKDFAKLAAAAQKLGSSIGEDAGKSVDDLTTAVARQSPMILDNLGVTLKVSEAHERYAASIGKSVNELTAAEKAEAFRVEALKAVFAAAENVTLNTDNASAAVKRFNVELNNLKTSALGGREVTTDYAKAVAALDSGAVKITANLRSSTVQFREYRSQLREAGVDTEFLSGLNRFKLADSIDRVQKAEQSRLLTAVRNGDVTEAQINRLEQLTATIDQSTNAYFFARKEIIAYRIAHEELQRVAPELALMQAIQISEQANLTLGSELARASDAKRARRGGGRRRDPNQDLIDRLEGPNITGGDLTTGQVADASFEQARRDQLESNIAEIEQMQLDHFDRMQQLEEEREQKKAEAEERAKKWHAAKLKRLAAEEKAQRAHDRMVIASVNASMSVMRDGIGIANLAAEAGIKSDERRARFFQRARGIESMAVGTAEAVKAAAAYASLNIPQGIAHTGAAAFAFAQGGLLLSGQIGGPSGAPTAAPGGGNADPIAPDSSARTPERGGIPTSPANAPSSANADGPQSDAIRGDQFTINFLGDPSDDDVDKIISRINERGRQINTASL